MSKQTKPSHDVTKESNPPIPATYAPYGPAKTMPQVEPPTAVGDPKSLNQPNFKAATPPISEAAKHLPTKITAAEIKQESLRHAQSNAMRGAAMSHDAIRQQSRKYGGW